jgi:hypothetical protein
MGVRNKRLKDEELILRFFALYYQGDKYQSPMNEFLNIFAKSHRNPGQVFLNGAKAIFCDTIDTVTGAIGQRSFRLERVVNAAVFDSVMVGVASRLSTNAALDGKDVNRAYTSLMTDKEYIKSVSQATSNEKTVKARLYKACLAFRDI